jgi:hypothetical protein
MARIRTIKPEFWRHEDLSALPESTHLLAAALLNYADDEGYFNANPKLIEAACFPLREPSVSVPDSLSLLVGVDYIRLGAGGDGKRYGVVSAFSRHQVVNRKTDSKIKDIIIKWDDSRSSHGVITDTSVPEGNREGKGREHEGGADAPPDLTVIEGGYAFRGAVIRLKREDYDRWRERYPHIGADERTFIAKLETADAYYSENPPKDGKWFFPVSRWLERENGEAAERKLTESRRLGRSF